MEDSIVALIATIVAPVITILLAKFKAETGIFKEKFKNITNLVNEINDALEDDTITTEESKKIIKTLRGIIK